MNENVPLNPFEHGPYVQVAAFCEQVIEGKDGVVSLIRVIDTLTHTEAGPSPPMEMPPVLYAMKLVLMIKSGHKVGRHEVKITPRRPSGEVDAPFTASIHLEGQNRGVNIIADISYQFGTEGLYWFDVYFDDCLLTRVPFDVKYKRVVVGGQ